MLLELPAHSHFMFFNSCSTLGQVRGWHATGGNAAPLGAVPALPSHASARLSPLRAQSMKHDDSQQQQQQHVEDVQQQDEQEQGAGHAIVPHADAGSTASSGAERASAEPRAIAGLEHCYRGGPTPLGLSSVARQQAALGQGSNSDSKALHHDAGRTPGQGSSHSKALHQDAGKTRQREGVRGW